MEYFHWPAWLSVWLCSLPAPAHLLTSWSWKTGKSPWFLSNWKHLSYLSYLHSSGTKSKAQQLLIRKLTLSQLKPGHYHLDCSSEVDFSWEQLGADQLSLYIKSMIELEMLLFEWDRRPRFGRLNPMTVFSRLIIAALEEEGLMVSPEVNCVLPTMVCLIWVWFCRSSAPGKWSCVAK